jgi:hypothetical protein
MKDVSHSVCDPAFLLLLCTGINERIMKRQSMSSGFNPGTVQLR